MGETDWLLPGSCLRQQAKGESTLASPLLSLTRVCHCLNPAGSQTMQGPGRNGLHGLLCSKAYKGRARNSSRIVSIRLNKYAEWINKTKLWWNKHCWLIQNSSSAILESLNLEQIFMCHIDRRSLPRAESGQIKSAWLLSFSDDSVAAPSCFWQTLSFFSYATCYFDMGSSQA